MGQDGQNGKSGRVALFSLEACSSHQSPVMNFVTAKCFCRDYHSVLKTTVAIVAPINRPCRKPKKRSLLANRVTIFMHVRCKSNAKD